jgi:hypothetical protein
MVRRGELALACLLALGVGAAPTVGDIGSCGRAATDLDPQSFASARKELDCRRCTECGLRTQTCQNACDPNAPGDVGWPSTCHPLEHDGEVCLRALQAASCGDYAGFVDDIARTAPTECDFCRLVPEAGVVPGEL